MVLSPSKVLKDIWNKQRVGSIQTRVAFNICPARRALARCRGWRFGGRGRGAIGRMARGGGCNWDETSPRFGTGRPSVGAGVRMPEETAATWRAGKGRHFAAGGAGARTTGDHQVYDNAGHWQRDGERYFGATDFIRALKVHPVPTRGTTMQVFG